MYEIILSAFPVEIRPELTVEFQCDRVVVNFREDAIYDFALLETLGDLAVGEGVIHIYL